MVADDAVNRFISGHIISSLRPRLLLPSTNRQSCDLSHDLVSPLTARGSLYRASLEMATRVMLGMLISSLVLWLICYIWLGSTCCYWETISILPYGLILANVWCLCCKQIVYNRQKVSDTPLLLSNQKTISPGLWPKTVHTVMFALLNSWMTMTACRSLARRSPIWSTTVCESSYQKWWEIFCMNQYVGEGIFLSSQLA